MYKSFYNIKFDPFSTLPSPDIFYDSGIHQDAWLYLQHGLSRREPILLIAGDHGTGKTLLCLKLLRELQRKKDSYCVHIPVPVYNYVYLLHEIARQLDIPVTVSDDPALQYIILQHVACTARGRVVYILIDNVQAMNPDELNKMLLLADFNYQEFFPVKFLLFAHRSLLEAIHQPPLLSFQYKLKGHFLLTGLNLPETKEYIYFRLLKAEAPGIPTFTDEAIEEIHSYSNGIPHLINKICEVCLVLGAEQKAWIIDMPLIAAARQRLDVEEQGGKTETKVNLVQEPHISAPVIDAYRPATDGYDMIGNKQIFATIRNVTAFLSFALVIVLFALGIISYNQYRLLHSFKKMTTEITAPVSRTAEKGPPNVSTLPIPSETYPLPEEDEFTRPTSVPVSPPVSDGAAEADTATSDQVQEHIANEPGKLEIETSQTDTRPESREMTTTISTSSAGALTEKPARYPYSIQLACYNSLPAAIERMALFKNAGHPI